MGRVAVGRGLESRGRETSRPGRRGTGGDDETRLGPRRDCSWNGLGDKPSEKEGLNTEGTKGGAQRSRSGE